MFFVSFKFKFTKEYHFPVLGQKCRNNCHSFCYFSALKLWDKFAEKLTILQLQFCSGALY